MRTYQRKKDGRWSYDFFLKGKRYRKVVKSARTKKEAEAAMWQVYKAVDEGRYGQPDGKESFAEFVNTAYLPYAKMGRKSYYHIQRYALILCEHFKNKTLKEINPLLIEQYRRQRLGSTTIRGQQRAAATINREVAMLSAILTYAVKCGFLAANPAHRVDRLKSHSRRNRVVSVEEETTLLRSLAGTGERYKELIVLALDTGMRRSEMLGLRWRDVDLERGYAILPDGSTKNGDGRIVGLTNRARAALNERRPGAPETKVFSGPGFNPVQVSNEVAKLCVKAGLQDVTLHTFRHTFQTRLIEMGANLLDVRIIMGHRSTKMTNHYYHPSPATLQKAVQDLEKWRDCRAIDTKVNAASQDA